MVDPCVYIHLNYYLEKCQLFHPFQSGSRRKYSCSTALARLTNSWLTAMNKSEVFGVVFLDLRKAFDIVDHDSVLKKLTCSLPFVFNHIFITERNASYTMALTLLNVWCTTRFCLVT